MVRGKKEIIDYVEEYTKSNDCEEIINESSILNNIGFNSWSFKKLIFLDYYLKLYLTILSNKSKCYFLDFFSGAGANIIEGKNLKSVGSPIISILKGVIPNKSQGVNIRFHKWIFLEKNKDFYEALKKRIEKTSKIVRKNTEETLKIGTDIEIFNEDSNIFINNLIEKIKRECKNERFSILVFIDPYKFSEIEWDTVKRILTMKYVDVIFNIPTNTFKRGVDKCNEKEKYLSPSLLKICSQCSFSNIPDDEISNLYAKDIVNIVGRSICYLSNNSVSVKNNCNSELYKIELFSHHRRAVEIAEDIAKRLKRLDCKNMNELVNQVLGKQTSLNKYF